MDELKHYGVKRRSGRYPWGSGEDPYQGLSGYGFYKEYEALKAKGLPPVEIAKKLNMNTTQLRNSITWATKERREFLDEQVPNMREMGFSDLMISQKLGISPRTVQNYLSPKEKVVKMQIDSVTNAITEAVDKHKYIDVGVGVERQLGISKTKLDTAVNKLAEEGYYVHEIYVKRLSDKTGQKTTTLKIITKEADRKEVQMNADKFRDLDMTSDDRGLTIANIKPPKHVDFDRIMVRYKEDGGEDKDGLIELRRDVPDLDLGRSSYAQVRIAAGENSYLKGMAAYTDDADFPKGIDIIFNTNKEKGTPKEKVFKDMKPDADNPFGTTIKIDGQRGALNIVNEEGDWDKWSTKMSSQFLSKQPTKLIKERLEDTSSILQKEFDEISNLTNPVVKKHLMDAYIDGLDTKAKHLKAQGLPGTKNHVILPVPTMNPNEVYATNYPNGTKVALVRHPHGGIFEIAALTVNNNNAQAKKMLGKAPDAIAIHPTVAKKLSGADFDGDTVLVIPNDQGKVKWSRSLAALKDFDPMEYKVPPDSPVNVYVKDPKTGELKNSGKTIMPQTKQTQMGVVSNLITDMTIKGAPQSEIARAVKHSMVVIDAEKHNLDYKRSARVHGINALKKQYQSHINPDTGKPSVSASTIISRSKGTVVDPVTGKKVAKINIKDPNFNPDKYVSGYEVDSIYSGFIKKVQVIRNKAIKVTESIKMPSYSKEAADVYKDEVKSLNEKLNKALLNAPKERQAQALTNHLYYNNVTKDMDKDSKEKLKSRSLARARVTVGAKKTYVDITDNEWEAIQARAISTTKLTQILDNADMNKIKKLATPRQVIVTPAKASRAKALIAKGKTYAEVAQALGVSVSTIRSAIE